MKRLHFVAGLMVFAVVLGAGRTAHACPACTEMVVAAGEDADDSDNFPAAVNQSIYVMVSAPYLSFAVVGFFVYRGVKKNREYLDGLDTAADSNRRV